MSHVMGNSKDVRNLQALLKYGKGAVEQNVSILESSKRTIQSAFQDEGFDDVEEIIKSITNALDNAKDAFPNIDRQLEAYAEFLEKTGR